MAANISLKIIKVEVLNAVHVQLADDEGVVCCAFVVGAGLQLLGVEEHLVRSSEDFVVLDMLNTLDLLLMPTILAY